MPSKNRHLLNWLWQQFQLKPGKPAYIDGVRILLILSGPIVVGIALGQTKTVAIAAISAFFVGLVNVNGTYRQQAKAIALATFGITLALLVANLVSGTVWLTLLTTFIVIFLLGLAGLYGAATAGVSLVVSMMFIVALARFSSFPNLTTVLVQCLLCLAGGVWTMVLSAGLWLVRPSTPAIESVADCYLALSKLTLLVKEKVSTPQSLESTKQFLQAQDVAIQNLTFARQIWTSVWTRDKSDRPRGKQLLVLIEDANQIINSLIILMELISISMQPQQAIADRDLFNYLKQDFARVIEQIAISLQRLSTALKKNRKSIPLEELEQTVATLEHQWQNLRSQVYEQTIEIEAKEYTDLVNLRKIIINLTKLSKQLHTDVEIATDVNLSTTKPNSFFFTQPDSSWFNKLKNNFTFRSVLFRHALRLALVVTLAQLLALLLPIPRGYWIALTALVALKPNFGGTFQSTGQRVLGTCVGSVIGIVLVTGVHNSIAIAIIILLLMFAAISFRPLSYSIFITLLTPVIILLLNALGAGDWEIGVLRIVDSLIGGALALLGSYLLFPSWERQQLPTQLEQTIRANLAYFQVAFERANSLDSLDRLRHQASLENANAEAAAQRLFSEPRHIQGEIEPVMTLMLYIRSLFSSVTTLSEHFKEFNSEERFTDFTQLINALEEVLNNLAEAVGNKQPPQPLPPLDNYLTQLRDRVVPALWADRIERLHNARISEFTTYPDTMTPTLQAVRQQTPVVIELERIVRAVTIMHCTIDRMQSNKD